MGQSQKVDVFISKEQIEKRVRELGEQITRDYAGQNITVVPLLSGAFMFVADLLRAMDLPVDVQFMAVSSYEGTQSTGEVKIKYDLKRPVFGKHVLLIEDIVDTGTTLKTVLEIMRTRQPASLKLASLLYKPARNLHPVDIDYLGFEIEDKFVIGYGLDYDGLYRELPYIGVYNG
jgi:hypoxanthine phosphoribosyltransferase